MKAAVRDRYGPPEIVEIADVETPVPTGDEVLVRVHAASVNRADLDGLYPRWQFTRAFTGLRRPRVPGIGLDVAGVVEAVGPEAHRFTAGDAVFASPRSTERTRSPTSWRHFATSTRGMREARSCLPWTARPHELVALRQVEP